jgi:hypothetical protein
LEGKNLGFALPVKMSLKTTVVYRINNLFILYQEIISTSTSPDEIRITFCLNKKI